MSTAYNLTIISMVLILTKDLYPETTNMVSALKTASLVGAIVGQLSMGYVADLMGRSAAMSITMQLTIAGALLSSFHLENIFGTDPSSPYEWIVFCRFLLGIGVGGVYPLAATIAAESNTDEKNRGREVSAIFSSQGVGFLLCPVVVMILVNINPDKPDDSDAKKGCNQLNWRLALAFGALPGLLVAPFKISETKKAESPAPLVETASTPGIAPTCSPVVVSSFWKDLGNSEYWPTLVGTAGGWFLFDITFYGNSLCSKLITDHVFGEASSVTTTMFHQLVIFAVALPGYWCATYTMDSLGRKNIQLFGFLMMTVLYGILALILKYAINSVPSAVLFIIYSLTFFFSNFGPNSTTFILPSESFPMHVRASMNGFSAASGKCGAAIGAYCFKPLSVAIGVPSVMGICALVSLVGLGVTYFFIEDRRGKAMRGDTEEHLIDEEDRQHC
eukprot:gene8862-10502_t